METLANTVAVLTNQRKQNVLRLTNSYSDLTTFNNMLFGGTMESDALADRIRKSKNVVNNYFMKQTQYQANLTDKRTFQQNQTNYIDQRQLELMENRYLSLDVQNNFNTAPVDYGMEVEDSPDTRFIGGTQTVPENPPALSTDLDNVRNQRTSMTGETKPLRDNQPTQVLYIEDVPETFNADSKAPVGLKTQHVYPDAPEYMGVVQGTIGEKRKRSVDPEESTQTKSRKAEISLFDAAPKPDANTMALVPVSVQNLSFNQSKVEPELVKRVAEQGSVYMERVQRALAKFKALTKNRPDDEATIGVSYIRLKETAPTGGKRGQIVAVL